MDDFEAVYNLYKDKAQDVIRGTVNFIIFFIITFLSVFIPLAYTVSDSTKTFIYFTILIPMVFFPISFFMHAKYREYKYNYKTALIKSIVRNDFSTPIGNPSIKSYREVSERITHITNINSNEVMTLLFHIYPPE